MIKEALVVIEKSFLRFPSKNCRPYISISNQDKVLSIQINIRKKRAKEKVF